MRIRVIIIFLLAVCSGLSAMGCSRGDGTGQSLNLVGSKQGQAVGFFDFDGDGIEDKIVGAPYASSGASIGAVLVYSGTATGYSSTISTLLWGEDDNFGYSFVNLGDIDDDGMAEFAIGAIHGSGEGSNDTSLSGAVTIYKGGGNGSVIKKLGGDGPMAKFGYSLAAGDLNADGVPDLIVGAPFNTNDPDLYQSGAVYIYYGPDFVDRTVLYASATNKGLGLALAAGDVNGDGAADMLISASGKVLVFFGGGSFNPVIDAPDITLTSSASGFGKSIAVIGDIDKDGKQEIAFGAPNATVNNYRDVGSIFIVKGTAIGTINLDASPPPADLLVRINGAGPFNRFGASIVQMGDIDGGSKPDFAVGAPMSDIITPYGQSILSGEVYLFKGEDISQTTTLSAATVFEGVTPNQQFGASLAKSERGYLLIGGPRSNMDTGGVMMIDPATGHPVAGGSSGGVTGGGSECH